MPPSSHSPPQRPPPAPLFHPMNLLGACASCWVQWTYSCPGCRNMYCEYHWQVHCAWHSQSAAAAADALKIRRRAHAL